LYCDGRVLLEVLIPLGLGTVDRQEPERAILMHEPDGQGYWFPCVAADDGYLDFVGFLECAGECVFGHRPSIVARLPPSLDFGKGWRGVWQGCKRPLNLDGAGQAAGAVVGFILSLRMRGRAGALIGAASIMAMWVF